MCQALFYMLWVQAKVNKVDDDKALRVFTHGEIISWSFLVLL